MNIKTTIALLLILAGIGVYFLFIEGGRNVTPGDEPAATSNVFATEQLYPDGIRQVVINNEGDKAILTRDSEGNWMQIEPVRFPLNAISLRNGLSYTAALLKFTDRFKAGESGKPTLAQMQLDHPRVTITFEGEYRDAQLVQNGREANVKSTPFKTTIKLGKTITGSRGYIQINDDPMVYVVNDELHRLLFNQTVRNWRVMALSVPEEAQARRISLLIDGRMVDIVKKDAEWRLGAPDAGRISTGAARALLAAVRQVKIVSFVDDDADLSRYGLDKPDAMITLQSSGTDAKPVTLRIGNVADIRKDTYHASWSVGDEPSRVVFTVLKQDRAYLSPELSELRDPRITPIDQPTFVNEIALHQPGEAPIHLRKETGKGWSFVVAPPPALTPDFQPDQDLVNGLIEVFTSATASYIKPTEPPSAQPLAEVELHSKSPLIDDTLMIYEPPQGLIPPGEEVPLLLVMRSNKVTGNEDIGYLVPRAKLEPALQPVATLRDRQVLALDPTKIDAMAIQRYDGVTYEFVRTEQAGQPWKLKGAEQFEWPALRDLFTHVLNLKIERWLDGPANLGEKVITFAIREGGQPARILTVDPATRHAMLTGEPTAFVVTPETAGRLELEYRLRSVLQEMPDNIAKVTVPYKDGKPLTIGKDDLGRYQALAADGTPLTTMKVSARDAALLFEGLAPLRVERYIDPLNVDWKTEAKIVIEVTTKTRIKYSLYLGFPGHDNVGLLNGRWFTLSSATLAKITGTAPKPPE